MDGLERFLCIGKPFTELPLVEVGGDDLRCKEGECSSTSLMIFKAETEADTEVGVASERWYFSSSTSWSRSIWKRCPLTAMMAIDLFPVEEVDGLTEQPSTLFRNKTKHLRLEANARLISPATGEKGKFNNSRVSCYDRHTAFAFAFVWGMAVEGKTERGRKARRLHPSPCS